MLFLDDLNEWRTKALHTMLRTWSLMSPRVRPILVLAGDDKTANRLVAWLTNYGKRDVKVATIAA